MAFLPTILPGYSLVYKPDASSTTNLSHFLKRDSCIQPLPNPPRIRTSNARQKQGDRKFHYRSPSLSIRAIEKDEARLDAPHGLFSIFASSTHGEALKEPSTIRSIQLNSEWLVRTD